MATLKYRKNSSSPWETLKALPQTGTVRYDLAQSLDTTQQRMARSNIGAAAASDVANAVEYEAQSGFTNLQREQACENIGAVTYLMDQILNETEKAQARKNIGVTSFAANKVNGDFLININVTSTEVTLFTLTEAGTYLISVHATLNSSDTCSGRLYVDNLNTPIAVQGEIPGTKTISMTTLCQISENSTVKAHLAASSASTQHSGTWYALWSKIG